MLQDAVVREFRNGEVISTKSLGSFKVPLQLKTHTSGVVYVWPITALLGAIGVIWGTDSRSGKVLDDPLSVERSR